MGREVFLESFMRHWFFTCGLLLIMVLGAWPVDARAEAAEPSTFLADAPDGPADAKAGDWLAQMKGWSRLEEDDKAHAFKGEPVFFNDKVVAVFEGKSAGVAVYSRQTDGAKLCARLQPICDG